MISVVIPVYRSADMLPELTDRLVSALAGTGEEFEVIFVDDDSPDHAWSVLRELAAKHPGRVLAIKLMRNFGQHNATMCGLRHARGQVVVTMDDDLQHPPEEVPRLLAALKTEGADVVYGAYEEKKHSWWRNVGSSVISGVYRFVFALPVKFSSFRAIRRDVLESALQYNLNYTFIDGLLAWSTKRIVSFPVKHEERRRGRSGYSVRKLLVLALNMLTNFSLLPLQAVSFVGFLAALLGFVFSAYYVAQKLLGHIEVLGFASIISAVFFFGGVQLLAIGMIGEYIGRVHLNINRKPQYVVREVMGARQNPD